MSSSSSKESYAPDDRLTFGTGVVTSSVRVASKSSGSGGGGTLGGGGEVESVSDEAVE